MTLQLPTRTCFGIGGIRYFGSTRIFESLSNSAEAFEDAKDGKTRTSNTRAFGSGGIRCFGLALTYEKASVILLRLSKMQRIERLELKTRVSLVVAESATLV